MTHQTLSLEKYWKLFPATLSRHTFLINAKLKSYANSVRKKADR